MHFDKKNLVLQYYAYMSPVIIQMFLAYFHELEVARVTHIMIGPIHTSRAMCRVDLYTEKSFADMLIATFADGILASMVTCADFIRARPEQLSFEQKLQQKSSAMSVRAKEIMISRTCEHQYMTLADLRSVDQSLGLYVEKVLQHIDMYIPRETGYMEIARVLRYAEIDLTDVWHENMSLQEHMNCAARMIPLLKK